MSDPSSIVYGLKAPVDRRFYESCGRILASVTLTGRIGLYCVLPAN